MRSADRHGGAQPVRGYLYGLSDDAILPPALASAAALLPSAILCIRFLVIPYGRWIPYLAGAIVLIPDAPVLCAFYQMDFGLIPSMIFGFMFGPAFSFSAAVLSALPKPTARETSPPRTALPTRQLLPEQRKTAPIPSLAETTLLRRRCGLHPSIPDSLFPPRPSFSAS